MTIPGGHRWWVRRGVLAAVLIGAVLFPGHSPAAQTRCRAARCLAGSAVRWTRRLPGSWVIGGEAAGTVPADGQGYVAADADVAVLGAGLTVYGYAGATGSPLWADSLTTFPAGSAIIAVRVWPGAVTVGVALPPGPSGQAARPPRRELVLNAATGAVLRSYPAASYGGAVSASLARTVIVGTGSVTCYLNATGRVAWRVGIGSAVQDWRVDGGDLYVTHVSEGVLGTAPVAFVRQISLRTGTVHSLHPVNGPFTGTLTGAADGVLLFSGPTALTGYSERNGQQLWQLAGVIPEMTDLVRQVLYVQRADRVVGIDPQTGKAVKGTAIPGPPGLFGVRDGVALGIDRGPAGSAWGYSIAARKIVWTTRQLPWPHFFVDLSGIGGSADPGSDLVLLAACRTSSPARRGVIQRCVQPELVAIGR